MKRSLLAGLGLLALLTVPAAAADIPRAAPYRAPVAVAGFNWTGFYAGLHGGYGWGSIGDMDPAGGFIGGQLGYNWQGRGSPWVLGVEIDSAWADLSHSGTFTSGATVVPARSEVDYMGSLRARVGYSVDRAMFYLTGGLAWMSNEVRVNTTAGAFTAGIASSNTHFGGTIGAGLEYAIAPNLSGKIEYLYAGYGDKTYFSGIGAGASLDADIHTVKAGLNYLFR